MTACFLALKAMRAPARLILAALRYLKRLASLTLATIRDAITDIRVEWMFR
ncbi:MAG: hypothetical protein ACRD3M_18695 [Thermoanaerobaculia bacterium]